MTKMVAGISKAAVEREATMMEASSNFIWAKKLRALRAALDKAEAERDQLLKPLETLQAQNLRLSGMVHDLRKEIADTDTLLIREAAASLDRLDRAEKAEAERDRLREALDGLLTSVEHADFEDGRCCCGDDMLHHQSPMDCGHTPVDMGEYHASLAIKEARAALKGETP